MKGATAALKSNQTSNAQDHDSVHPRLSTLLVALRKAKGNGIDIRPIATMRNHNTTEVFVEDMGLCQIRARVARCAGGWRAAV
ncbi:hypothetical protein [Burkholderia sp. Ac-20365]|jgi:hypothetical protein|uniref:hypothetical protein n=1 Tax=Burkholderia sp. Ac-20365 TaxID=2703897 RepID=UPI00197C1E03|nr:hypothetical protein [Burkholderia sp. Ac-20365]MBN3760689.1 hypothetical protein [Burkholderia sp. Ac-20365]